MANSNPLSEVEITGSNTPPIIPPSHYHGVGSRRSKWTSQIYSWHYSKTIWLGTYSTPEMAAIAYDVAALALNGDNTMFNFPDAIRSHPTPKSTSIVDIQEAASTAASQFGARHEVADAYEAPSEELCEYVDEEELFNMPQVLIEMAEGLMVSPPRLSMMESDEPLEALEDDNLWNFDE